MYKLDNTLPALVQMLPTRRQCSVNQCCQSTSWTAFVSSQKDFLATLFLKIFKNTANFAL